jgi:hypothetical protein
MYVLKFGSERTPFQLGKNHYRHVNILGADFFFTFGCVLVYDYHNGTADMYLRSGKLLKNRCGMRWSG